MKKIIITGLAILGSSFFANAWYIRNPQVINPTLDGKYKITCLNTTSGICMVGAGNSPTKGQDVLIWVLGRAYSGVLLKANANPNIFQDGTVPDGVSTEMEVSIEGYNAD